MEREYPVHEEYKGQTTNSQQITCRKTSRPALKSLRAAGARIEAAIGSINANCSLIVCF
jgi:hypothetical protein